MILKILILLFSLLLNGHLYAGERNHQMEIVLVPVGDIEKKMLEGLRNDLGKAFNREIVIGREMPEPDYAFNKSRKQYLSTAILNAILAQKEYAAYDKNLGIVDHDLFVPELNFVFGKASREAAVISLTRLRQSFYGQPEDPNLFHKRTLTEAVHELGHTYGLGHCENPHCVMFFSNSLKDTDRKGPEFCPRCKGKLNKQR